MQAPAHDSLIKARYASTILRVARSCDRKMAAHLVAAIASDFPLESEVPKSRISTDALLFPLLDWQTPFATRLAPTNSHLGQLR